jgi:HTH-type transcriptional regulator/antitoxin HigA
MNAFAIDYGVLLKETRPEVIHSEQQNAKFIAMLEKLTSMKRVTPAQKKLIEMLVVLVEKYESKYYPVPDAGPLDIIRHLMEQHGLRQKDLVDVFGTESIVSDVLNGKRDLTKDHIIRLSARFHVSPAVFFLNLSAPLRRGATQPPVQVHALRGIHRGDVPVVAFREFAEGVKHVDWIYCVDLLQCFWADGVILEQAYRSGMPRLYSIRRRLRSARCAQEIDRALDQHPGLVRAHVHTHIEDLRCNGLIVNTIQAERLPVLLQLNLFGLRPGFVGRASPEFFRQLGMKLFIDAKARAASVGFGVTFPE